MDTIKYQIGDIVHVRVDVDRFFSRYYRDRGAEVVQSPPDHTAYA